MTETFEDGRLKGRGYRVESHPIEIEVETLLVAPNLSEPLPMPLLPSGRRIEKEES